MCFGLRARRRARKQKQQKQQQLGRYNYDYYMTPKYMQQQHRKRFLTVGAPRDSSRRNAAGYAASMGALGALGGGGGGGGGGC